MTYSYKKAAVGGTFDRIHTGHERLLRTAFDMAESVVIGLTSNEFVVDKELSRLILPYSERKIDLDIWLQSYQLEKRAEIVQINDIFGTTLKDPELDLLVVSEQTLAGAEKVNQKRVEIRMKPLEVKVVNMVNDETSQYLSSTRIRMGKVNRQGTSYASVFSTAIKLSDDQKQTLKFPMGPLVRQTEIAGKLAEYSPTLVAVVGDVSLRLFLDEKIPYDFGVFDGHTRRNTPTSSGLNLKEDATVINPAGVIDTKAVGVLETLVRNGGGILKVEGEEDLLVLPLVLLLPLGSVVVYGQPGEGLVFVPVTSFAKERWYRFLR